MDKQEIIEQIEELKQKIEVIENNVTSPKFEDTKKYARKRPKYGESYHVLTDFGKVIETIWYNLIEADFFRFKIGNCFKTEQEAKDYKENTITKRELRDLALELNRGVKIDWKDYNQCKFFLYYSSEDDALLSSYCYAGQITLGQIYCLDFRFLEIAQERIGKERLVRLIKSGV